ncbi:MAG: protein translocase SEC61 complex subunit gamma [Candidatus Geothermarchaeales archaeon]
MKRPGGFQKYRRVIRMAKKPGLDEFWLFAKLTILGVGILGLIAFIIRLLVTYLLTPISQ